jgi:hypothetical protein
VLYRPAAGFAFEVTRPLLRGGLAGVAGAGVAAATGRAAGLAGLAFATLVGVTALDRIAADRPVLALGLLGDRYCTALPPSQAVASVREDPEDWRVVAGALPGDVVPRTVVVRTRLFDAPAVVETCGDFGATVFEGITISEPAREAVPRDNELADSDALGASPGGRLRAFGAAFGGAVDLCALAWTHRSTARGGLVFDSVPRSTNAVRLVGGLASAGAPPPTSEGAEAAASPGISTARTTNRRRKESSRPTFHFHERAPRRSSLNPAPRRFRLGL